MTPSVFIGTAKIDKNCGKVRQDISNELTVYNELPLAFIVL